MNRNDLITHLKRAPLHDLGKAAYDAAGIIEHLSKYESYTKKLARYVRHDPGCLSSGTEEFVCSCGLMGLLLDIAEHESGESK